MKHTPGPWRLAGYDGDPRRYVIGPENELVADCYAATPEDYDLPRNYKANALLISQAPALLNLAGMVAAGNTEIAFLEGIAKSILKKLEVKK